MTTFTAYFDESGTHDGAASSVMAGFLGDDRQCRKFYKRAGKLFNRYRVNIFHTIDVRRGDDDFAGWTVDRKLEFSMSFSTSSTRFYWGGVVSTIRNDDYEYYSSLNWPKGRRDSKYGVLFRGCLAQIIDIVGHLPLGREPRLFIVLEDGHKNAADTTRIYEWAQDQLGPRRALSGLTFVDKKSSLPIAAADLLAYSAWSVEAGRKPIGVLKGPSKSDTSYRGNLHRVELNRDSLNSLHEQAIQLAQSSAIRVHTHDAQ
jgi:Protein of unknown function (DUF3800)